MCICVGERKKKCVFVVCVFVCGGEQAHIYMCVFNEREGTAWVYLCLSEKGKTNSVYGNVRERERAREFVWLRLLLCEREREREIERQREREREREQKQE